MGFLTRFHYERLEALQISEKNCKPALQRKTAGRR